MCDYICVDARAYVESDAEAAGVGGGICVGDLGDAGRARKAERDWGGRVIEMGCGGEFFGFRAGREGAIEHQAASVCCSGVS